MTGRVITTRMRRKAWAAVRQALPGIGIAAAVVAVLLKGCAS